MKPAPCFAIVGTDTEVGKTMVACGLARAMTDAGYSVIAVKPVETGCTDEQIHRQDGALLAQATGQAEPSSALFKFPTPVAPPVAADLVGEELDYSKLICAVRAAYSVGHIRICEGAGGLLSPLTWSTTMLEVCRDLEATAVVVAANRLGVINHTLLTVEVLRQAKIPVGAVVLNHCHPMTGSNHISPSDRVDASMETNLSSLRRLLPDVPVVYMPWVKDMADAACHLAEFAVSLTKNEN